MCHESCLAQCECGGADCCGGCCVAILGVLQSMVYYGSCGACASGMDDGCCACSGCEKAAATRAFDKEFDQDYAAQRFSQEKVGEAAPSEPAAAATVQQPTAIPTMSAASQPFPENQYPGVAQYGFYDGPAGK